MKDPYPENIMLCFLQGFGDGDGYRIQDAVDGSKTDVNKKIQDKRVSLSKRSEGESQLTYRKNRLISGKTLRLSSVEQIEEESEVKRSLSDRFSVINNGNSRKTSRGFLTIRKTWSTGNFPSGAAGGGCGAPRSAPATPLQLEPHPRTKHDKQVLKPLSGSAPSVRTPALTSGGETEGKAPSKSRQKKFQRHFPQVGPEERVLNYYSCALVGDLLLQGHLYITKNYFAFYSNVFGYVTKLLIPTISVLRITKEKVARIIPNAVGVCTRDERHVFGSLLSRDSTYKLMMNVWKAARGPELAMPQPKDLRTSEVELDASEYSPEDDSSSGGADRRDVTTPPVRRESEAIIATVTAGAAVIQPALLLGSTNTTRPSRKPWRFLVLCCSVVLACTASLMLYRLWQPQELSQLSGQDLYWEMVRVRSKLHGRAAGELHAFLSTNLLLLTKVRQSLEALSGVILADMSVSGNPPERTDAFS